MAVTADTALDLPPAASGCWQHESEFAVDRRGAAAPRGCGVRAPLAALALAAGGAVGAYAQGGPAFSDLAEAVVVEHRAFGVIMKSRTGRPAFLATTDVPYVPGGDPFGWVVRLKTTKTTVLLREELQLPAPAATWGPVQSGREISADGRSATTVRSVDLDSHLPFISNFWQVGAGDPKGEHTVRVFIDGHKVGEFNFQVR